MGHGPRGCRVRVCAESSRVVGTADRLTGAATAVLKPLRCCDVARAAGLWWLQAQNGVKLEGGRIWINVRKNFTNGYEQS